MRKVTAAQSLHTMMGPSRRHRPTPPQAEHHAKELPTRDAAMPLGPHEGMARICNDLQLTIPPMPEHGPRAAQHASVKDARAPITRCHKNGSRSQAPPELQDGRPTVGIPPKGHPQSSPGKMRHKGPTIGCQATKAHTSDTSAGQGHLATGATFSGSLPIPDALTIRPRKATLHRNKWHPAGP